MPDAWVGVSTVARPNATALRLGQTAPDEAWQLPGDIIHWRWREGIWTTCLFSQHERTRDYFFLLSDVPATVVIGVDPETDEDILFPVADLILRHLCGNHVVHDAAFETVTRKLWKKRRVLPKNDYSTAQAVKKMRAHVPPQMDDSLGGRARDHFTTYFNDTVEQPTNSYVTVPWDLIDGFFVDWIDDIPVTAAALLAEVTP